MLLQARPDRHAPVASFKDNSSGTNALSLLGPGLFGGRPGTQGGPPLSGPGTRCTQLCSFPHSTLNVPTSLHIAMSLLCCDTLNTCTSTLQLAQAHAVVTSSVCCAGCRAAEVLCSRANYCRGLLPGWHLLCWRRPIRQYLCLGSALWSLAEVLASPLQGALGAGALHCPCELSRSPKTVSFMPLLQRMRKCACSSHSAFWLSAVSSNSMHASCNDSCAACRLWPC